MHFIFEVDVKPGYTAEQYAEAWVRASKIIQQAPGALATGAPGRSNGRYNRTKMVGREDER